MATKVEKKPAVNKKEIENKKVEKAPIKVEKRPPKEVSDVTKAAIMECSFPRKSKEGNSIIKSSSCRDWTEMPLGVLGDITKALPYIDRCRFRAVCHQWNEAALSIMRKRKKNRSGASGGDVDVKKNKEVEVDDAKFHIDYHPYGGHPRSPWLMLPVRKEKGTHHGFCSLAEVAKSEAASSSTTSINYFFRLNHLPSIGHIAGTSPGGWILYVDDYGELHALNIFTLVEIDAPPLATFSGILEIHRDDQGRATSYTCTNVINANGGVENYKMGMSFYSQALIFFPPLLNTNSSSSSYCCAENKDDVSGSRVRKGRYLFVVIRGVFLELAYAWEGDQSWTDVDPQKKTYHFCNLLLHNGLIYAIAIKSLRLPDHNFGFVVSFDPTLGFKSFKILDAPFYHTRTRIPSGQFELLLSSHIVEISGELWVVNRDVFPNYHNKKGRMQHGRNGRRGINHTDMCYFFRLDKEANQWIEIHDGFGDGLALFLGTNQSLVLSTSEFPHLKSGCIYFTDNSWNLYDIPAFDRGIGVFDLKTKTFNFDCHWRPKGNNFPPAVWLLR